MNIYVMRKKLNKFLDVKKIRMQYSYVCIKN